MEIVCRPNLVDVTNNVMKQSHKLSYYTTMCERSKLIFFKVLSARTKYDRNDIIDRRQRL